MLEWRFVTVEENWHPRRGDSKGMPVPQIKDGRDCLIRCRVGKDDFLGTRAIKRGDCSRAVATAARAR